MSITQKTKERPGTRRQTDHQVALNSDTQQGASAMNQSTTKAPPRAEELCNIMSDLAGRIIHTVSDMGRFADEVGIYPSDLLKAADTIARIEAHQLQAGN
ncbi:hypothetical protein I2485_01385 [Nesterenkonia sp. E16_7]|uniref:hypothetical protein n=1 Tax=unclassified Nesterenkonia TaxID=2629769 RepID=UPI001A91E977|nr:MULTISPECIES: hypothetical protein [unclassified Nesterenkonia]MBO0596472.1 hypothetical protein [Nesterenkonia sp. E16_10]MBO0597300.1 hypothetical protein [Nesterenkonia sp. E16_7]